MRRHGCAVRGRRNRQALRRFGSYGGIDGIRTRGGVVRSLYIANKQRRRTGSVARRHAKRYAESSANGSIDHVARVAAGRFVVGQYAMQPRKCLFRRLDAIRPGTGGKLAPRIRIWRKPVEVALKRICFSSPQSGVSM